MLRMDKVSKKQFGHIAEYFCGKNLNYGTRFCKCTSFGKFFSIMALADVKEGGTPYMGISPGRVRPCTHRPERELHPAALLLGKSGSKEVLVVRGKITMFSFQKKPALRKQWMQFVFRSSNGVSQVCLLTNVL